MSFEKVLVANRGEIACRVLQSARSLGYRTVAVFSEADAGARHVQLADEAVCIGPATAAESYLNVPALLDACRRSGADAVHPGYGFLSENADFAAACAEAGVTFIGPPAEAIRLMGSKRLSKIAMQEAGVPCVPGSGKPLGDDIGENAALLVQAQVPREPCLVEFFCRSHARQHTQLRASNTSHFNELAVSNLAKQLRRDLEPGIEPRIFCSCCHVPPLRRPASADILH